MPNIPENDDDTDMAGSVLGGGRAGEFMQARFTRIPDAHLNRETVAGIRDMNLGKVKNGKPVGKSTSGINEEIIWISISMAIAIAVLIAIALCYILKEKCTKKQAYRDHS